MSAVVALHGESEEIFNRVVHIYLIQLDVRYCRGSSFVQKSLVLKFTLLQNAFLFKLYERIVNEVKIYKTH